jgi:hypothetical protein
MVRVCVLFLAASCLAVSSLAQPPASSQSKVDYKPDFDFYWQTVHDDFAYFDGQARKRSDWLKVRDIYATRAAAATTRGDVLRLLESANNELFNGHVTLNANSASSNRIIPSGSDLWAVPDDGRFVITDVREGFNSAESGLKTGMVLKTFDSEAIEVAVKKFLPLSASVYTAAMYEYAVNMLLAGSHDKPRTIGVLQDGAVHSFHPDEKPDRVDAHDATLLSSQVLPSGIGYIQIHNSLGEMDLIKSFDKALDSMMTARGIILDLRETPSGGNTTVARGILGRFVEN